MSSKEGKLKIAILGAENSIHLQRWVKGLLDRGIEITLYTQHSKEKEEQCSAYEVIKLPFSGALGYLLNVPFIIAGLRRLKPHILHAHYLSGYGTSARLTGYRPFIVSVWGSDIFSFPNRGWLEKRLARKNLNASYSIMSTSKIMAVEIAKYISPVRPIVITPFGIDTIQFFPAHTLKQNSFYIGMIKKLDANSGCDVLIKAFSEFTKLISDKTAVLLIAGDGSEKKKYERMAEEYGISNNVKFLGSLKHQDVPKFMGMLDIYCAPSKAESFGVAILEAQASGVPVVAARIGGIPEVVIEDQTAYLVDSGDYLAFAKCFLRLENDSTEARLMGQEGVAFVNEKYSWDKSIDIMIEAYDNIVNAYY